MLPMRLTNRAHARSAIVANRAGFTISIGLTANDSARSIGAIHGSRRCRSTRALHTGCGAYVAVRHLRLSGGLRHLGFRRGDRGEWHKLAQREHSSKDRAFHQDCLSYASGWPNGVTNRVYELAPS
jgi:hypothetical protein